MRTASILFAFGLLLSPRTGRAAGPTVAFTLPAQDTTPSTFGSIPFPNDLYFDGGKPADGDGTLLNAGLAAGAKMGLAAQVVTVNTEVVEDALDQLDGFGTTSAVYFFLSGPIDYSSLPTSPVLAPSLTDSVFCANATTAVPVPITLKAEVDSRIPYVLAVQPLAGRPLAANTRYTCVVRRSVTGGAEPVEASADFASVRDGVSANSDADDVYDPVVATLGLAGVAPLDIAGMTVFTTQSTVADLIAIHDVVLPGEPVPTANFTSRPELVFDTDAEVAALLGSTPHAHIAKVATGYYASPRFQTPDPDGDGPAGDLPIPPSFASCLTPCETTDETFTHDGGGNPVVIDAPPVPVTVIIPTGTAPLGGWPVVIQLHGLGGQRDMAVRLADAAAARGFATVAIDAVAHGYRFFGCTPSASCSQDTANNFGGTAVPDGFVDGTFAGYELDVITANLGFLQAVHNLLGVRDNLRQTVADLFSLVRLLQGHSIDGALGTALDAGRLFYVGHSLGGLVGTGFVALEPQIKAALLNAAGGDFVTRLFTNSARGAGSLELAAGVLGLDPANIADEYSLAFNLAQTVIDPADALSSAALLLAPPSGPARNVIAVEALDDEEIPNQATEALAVAAGLPLFDPFVQNLSRHALTLSLVSTVRSVRANVAGGTATAALVQTGFATPDGATIPSTVTQVPGFALWDEFSTTGQPFPTLTRGVRVASPGVVDSAFAWFADVIANGTPGTFAWSKTPTFNPVQSADVQAGPSLQQFFNRTVAQGSSLSAAESTPDVTVFFTSNLAATRLTLSRSVLGATAAAGDVDVPPGPMSTVGTLGILPFYVTLQREVPGTFSADLTVAYSITELAVAGITPASSEEATIQVAAFQPGACAVGAASCAEDADCDTNGPCQGSTYALLPTVVDTVNHRVTASGVTDTGIFAVMHPDVLLAGFRPPLIAGGAGAISDCRGEWQAVNALNTPFRDSKGRVNPLQICRDGDVTCDADRTVNGRCMFRMGICFNYPDPILPLCSVGLFNTTSYQVNKPKPLSRKVVDSTNAVALLSVIEELGGVRTGLKLNVVTFTPPFSTSRCSDLFEFRVDIPPNRFFGKANVRGKSSFDAGPLDAGGDTLRIRCYPPSFPQL